jgi:hypothetical protein
MPIFIKLFHALTLEASMRKIFAALIVSALFGSLVTNTVIARADEDAQCLDNCVQGGYASQYCEEKCADDSNPMTRQQTIRQVEPHCMDDCTSSGHDTVYCTKACTY